jgi:hypothetical protein
MSENMLLSLVSISTLLCPLQDRNMMQLVDDCRTDCSEAVSMISVNLLAIDSTVGNEVSSILTIFENRDQSSCFTTQFGFHTS